MGSGGDSGGKRHRRPGRGHKGAERAHKTARLTFEAQLREGIPCLLIVPLHPLSPLSDLHSGAPLPSPNLRALAPQRLSRPTLRLPVPRGSTQQATALSASRLASRPHTSCRVPDTPWSAPPPSRQEDPPLPRLFKSPLWRPAAELSESACRQWIPSRHKARKPPPSLSSLFQKHCHSSSPSSIICIINNNFNNNINY